MASVLVGDQPGIVYGSAGDDVFKNVANNQWIIQGTHTLSGGAGNDAYYVTGDTIIVEAPNGGFDTVVSQDSYKLPDNVEALEVWGTGAGYGNDGDNFITAHLLNGGKGNDQLTGVAAGDVFQFDAVSGHDRITNWNGNDLIRLAGYSQFSNFDQVKSALSQVGNDVVLKLDANNDVTLLNTKLASVGANNFQYTLDLSKYNLTLSFADEFNQFSSRATRSSPGTWSTEQGDSRGSDALESRTLMSNGERQIYVDPGFKNLGLNPFSVADGVLSITAQAAPTADKSALYNYDYTSGYISTRDTFAQQYGYFEARLELPAATGSWPAFWMFRKDGVWPPELDIMEAWNNTTAVQTVHTNQTAVHSMTSAMSWVPDGDTTFHNYGLLWTPDKLTWYIDGVEVFSQPTPADMHSPMYLILNLAISGAVSDPNFHEQLKVDYVHAYAFNELPPSLVTDMGAVADNAYGLNPAFYRAMYPDVAAAGLDPLYHFERYGKAEGRLPYQGASTVAASNLYAGKIDGMPDGFNPDYYAAHNPDVVAAHADLLAHYLKYGKIEGRLPYDPTDVATADHAAYFGARSDKAYGFNYAYYAMHNPDVVAAGANLLEHYEKYGKAEGRLPFDPNATPVSASNGGGSTASTPPVVTPPVVVPPVTPAPPAPPATPAAVDKSAETTPHAYWGAADVKHDGFNLAYYTSHNPDVVAAGVDPLQHYLQHGKAEGRLAYDPTDTTAHADWGKVAGATDGFNADYYKTHNPDIVLAGLDPLTHYLANGKAEGRLPYDQAPSPTATATPPPAVVTPPVTTPPVTTPPVTTPPVTAVPTPTPPTSTSHAFWGAADMKHDGFNLAYYTSHNPDVVAAGVDPLQHYIRYGKAEGRPAYDPTDTSPHADWGKITGATDGFNADYYTTHNPDVVLAGLDPLTHYLASGKAEGRLAYDQATPVVTVPAAPAPVATAVVTPEPAAAPPSYTLHTNDVVPVSVSPTVSDVTPRTVVSVSPASSPAGAVRIFGTGGDDVLVAPGGGADGVMAGGAGNDIFRFTIGMGRETVNDFDAAHDRLDASALISAYGAPTISNFGSGSLAHFAGGEEVVLLGVSAAQAQLVLLG